MTADSTATSPVASAGPVVLSSPAASGTAQRASLLSGSPGNWGGVGDTYAYQWQRSPDNGTTWANISGATALNYVIGSADEGCELRLTVTATNADGSASASSQPTAIIPASPPVATGSPIVTGTAQRASTLTATQGTWSGIGNTYSYQWQRNAGAGFVDIAGATSPTYTLTTADEGATVRAEVIATNPDATVTAASAPTGTVAGAPPVNTVSPATSGTAQRGQTLTGTQGVWTGVGNGYSYQWQRSPDGTTWTSINGATGLAYVLTLADEGDLIRLQVTATNPDQTVTAGSAATAAVSSSPPANLTVPTLAGTAQRGQTLTGSEGSWTGNGNVYTYQWQRSADGSTWTNILGATSLTYTVTSTDEHNELRLQVSASNADGTVTVGSAPTSAVAGNGPTNTTLPAVSGNTTRGSVLTASQGTWTGDGNSYAYQWQRSSNGGASWSNIAGVTATTYTLGAVDEGSELRVAVTATNTDGSFTIASASTATITGAPPIALSEPSVNGTPERTATLSATPGQWAGAGNSYTYQWQHSADSGSTWTNIAGATGPAYTLTFSDEGQNVRAQVRATNADGSLVASSTATAPIGPALPAVTTAPVLTGADGQGQTLSASNGAWAPDTTGFTYGWQRSSDGVNWSTIAGATSDSYTLTGADVGYVLRAAVTATNVDGTATAFTAASTTVVGPPQNLTAPAAPGGTTQTGSTLSADPGTWNEASAALTYVWERCPAGTGTITSVCAPVGAGSTYTLSGPDIGSTLGVEVTASSTGGTTTVASPLTGAITATPLYNVTPPSISGDPQIPDTLNANQGSWNLALTSVGFTWERCDADGKSNCVTVGISSSYTLSAADSGHAIVLAVTAQSPGESVTLTTPPLLVQTQPTPQNTAAPTLSGGLQRTDTLTAAPGSWSNEPSGYGYQWERCDGTGANCQPIAGQTGATYALSSADEGAMITVAVTATNASGSGTAAAKPAGPVTAWGPVNTMVPQLSYTAPSLQPSVVLTVSGARWNAAPDTTYTYQWQRSSDGGVSWTAIPGASAVSYTLAAADMGFPIRVQETASNVDGSAQADSQPTAIVGMAPPRWRTLPVLSSDKGYIGDALSITPGVWSGPPVSTDTVQMMRCTNTCSADGPADTSTYTIAGTDLGAILRVQETASNTAGSVVVWSPSYVGPVLSAAAGATVLNLKSSAPVPVRNADGKTLATARLLPAGSTASGQGSGTASARQGGGGAGAVGLSSGSAAPAAAARTALERRSAKPPASHGTAAGKRSQAAGRIIQLARAAGIRGPMAAWACQASFKPTGKPGLCSPQVAVGRAATLRLPAKMTGKLRIVVVEHRPARASRSRAPALRGSFDLRR